MDRHVKVLLYDSFFSILTLACACICEMCFESSVLGTAAGALGGLATNTYSSGASSKHAEAMWGSGSKSSWGDNGKNNLDLLADVPPAYSKVSKVSGRKYIWVFIHKGYFCSA